MLVTTKTMDVTSANPFPLSLCHDYINGLRMP